MPRPDPDIAARMVLASAALVACAMGSIHGFSVFLQPLEMRFEASRSAVSLTYSMALVALTIVVLLGPRLYGRGTAAGLMALACGLAAAGALVAAKAGALPMVWLGYSLIFGAANGLGYGFGLQIAAQAYPGREGLAMGGVTAAYALGAVLSPALFDAGLRMGGFGFAMAALALALVIVGALSAGLMQLARARFQTTPPQATAPPQADLRMQILLWLGYFGAVLAGLMVIGHAAGIAQAFHPDAPGWHAPMIIAACNLLGSLTAGQLADRVALWRLLAALAGLTSLALLTLATLGHTGAMLASFGLAGFAYGGTIAVYPAAIAKLFGIAASARIYGRVFTAWGAAGLLGPWLAGGLFDLSGSYLAALWVAAACGLISAGTIRLALRPSG